MQHKIWTLFVVLVTGCLLSACASPSEFIDQDSLAKPTAEANRIQAQLTHAPGNKVHMRLFVKVLNGKDYSSSLGETSEGWRAEQYAELKSILTAGDLFDENAGRKVVLDIRKGRVIINGKTDFSVSARALIYFALEDADGNTLFFENCSNESTADFVSDALTWDGLYNAAQMKAAVDGFICFREALIKNSDKINKSLQALN